MIGARGREKRQTAPGTQYSPGEVAFDSIYVSFRRLIRGDQSPPFLTGLDHGSRTYDVEPQVSRNQRRWYC